MKGTYYIGSSADTYWTKTTAKTLIGAKRLASMAYQPSVGGRIEVGIARDETSIDCVAVKYGYDKDWAPR